MKPYKPRKRNQLILDTAYQHVVSVPYKVSLRWVFYRLLQEGLYNDKKDYEKMKNLFSTARKRFYKQWEPNTLADETREAIIRHGQHETPLDWLSHLATNSYCWLDEWYSQDYYVEVLYEAKAMTDQFKTYVPRPLSLVPLGGDPSIPYKWAIAKRLEKAYVQYSKPIVILYFGDKDAKGEQIPKSALIDIQNWCNVLVEPVVCGLTEEQAKKYNLPVNPEKPREYQWEALTDAQAKEIISEFIGEYIDQDALGEIENKEKEATKLFRGKMTEFMNEPGFTKLIGEM